MSILSLFRETREVRQFAERPVFRELILSILEDAVWAPNHKLREPWRFIYADGTAKQKLTAVSRTTAPISGVIGRLAA